MIERASRKIFLWMGTHIDMYINVLSHAIEFVLFYEKTFFLYYLIKQYILLQEFIIAGNKGLLYTYEMGYKTLNIKNRIDI